MIHVEIGLVSSTSDPKLQFVHALRAAYRHEYVRARLHADCDVTIQLSVEGLRQWSVAHRRMLHRVLLGLGVTGELVSAYLSGVLPRGGCPAGRGSLPVPGGAPCGAPAEPAGPGLGAFTPGRVALLVGDRPGVGWSGRLNWPFISGHRGGCSAWLADQLEAGGIKETKLYWVNATDQVGTPTSSSFLTQLQPRLIVALGKNAGRWCREQLGHHATIWPVEEVHHPQFWKRFHPTHKYRLLKVLQKGLS